MSNEKEKKNIKCLNCGADLPDNSIFCTYCGEKVPDDFQWDANWQNSEKRAYVNASSGSSTFSQKVKEKVAGLWNGLSAFGKVVTVSIILFVLLFLVSFAMGKTFAWIVALIQIGLVIVSVLMKKEMIPTSKTWLYLVIFILAVALVIPYGLLVRVNKSNAEKFKWYDIVLSYVIPEPKSNRGEIIINSEEVLSLYIYKTSKADYEDYIGACKDRGFTVETQQGATSFFAYNEGGYELSLDYVESDKKMHIRMSAPMKLGQLKWSESEMAKLLPIPDSTVGKIEKDDETGFIVYVGKISVKKFREYVMKCSEMGFNVDVDRGEKYYAARNADAYKLQIDYQGNSVICISVSEPEYKVALEVQCVGNWFFSKYDVKVYVNNLFQGTIPHGETKTVTDYLKKGTYTVKFESADNSDLTGETEINIVKDDTYVFKISCSSSGISVKQLSGGENGMELPQTETSEEKEPIGSEPPESSEMKPLEPEKITATQNGKDFIGMNYTQAEKMLRDMGFTNFEYEVIKTDDLSKTDGTVGTVGIKAAFGSYGITEGEAYNLDSIVVIGYYECDEWSDLVGASLAEAKKRVKEKGYTASYTYSNSGMDATGDVEYFDDEHYVNDSKVTEIKNVDKASKKVEIIFRPADVSDANAEFNKLNEKLNIDVAWGNVEYYGKQHYNGFKIHQITGILAETPQNGDTWFLKAKCEYKNAYGIKEEHTVEAYVTGTTENPVIESFTVY